MHDILGHYNRFDIFDLRVNIAPTRKITFTGGEAENQDSGNSSSPHSNTSGK
jgi:hypothetical protein